METFGFSGSRIVVGVEDSLASSAAVAWAVDECAMRGTALLMAHCPAPPDPRQVWAGGEAALRAMDQHADALLNAFASATSRRRRSVVVGTHLSHSEPASALVDLSNGSDLLVVGAPGGNSTAFGVGRRVAVHALCPVVVVPAPPVLPRADRAIRIVFVSTGGPHDLLARRFAEREAALRSIPLDQVRHDEALVELRADPAVLAVVGRRASEDRWNVRLDGPLDGLLAAVPCPVVVVGDPAPSTAASPVHDLRYAQAVR